MSNEEIIADLLRRVEHLEATRTFLTPEEISVLTGRKSKSLQIEALRSMGLPFFVTGIGHPVVARSAVEGGRATIDPPSKEWIPSVLRKK